MRRFGQRDAHTTRAHPLSEESRTFEICDACDALVEAEKAPALPSAGHDDHAARLATG
jgi:hypothetical protein